MSIHAAFRGPDGHLLDVSTRVGKFQVDVTENAEEMDSAQSTIVLDDPLGDLVLNGFRIFTLWEDEVPGPDKHFYVGYVGQKRIKRGKYRTGVKRIWEVDLHDINSIFSRRVLLDADANRPAELDYERVRWWNQSHYGSLIDDSRYLFEEDGVPMDACDYRLQDSDSLLRDCMRAGGKNLYASYSADLFSDADNPWGNFWLWFGRAEREEYVSDVSLSNVLSELDIGASPRTVFEPLLDAEETQDPDRVYSRIIVPYGQSYATANNPATEAAFALSGRDSVMSEANIKTKAKAQARANRYVHDLATELQTGVMSFYVPRSQVNDVRPGMLVGAHLTHLPAFQDTPMSRVLSRGVAHLDAEDQYLIKVTLETPTPYVAPVGAGGILYRGTTVDGSGQLWFDASGDAPEAGLPLSPTVGLIEMVNDPGGAGGADRPFSGIKMLGSGTVDGKVFATWAGVEVGIGNEYTITLSLAVNGTVVDSEVSIVGIPVDADGFLAFASGGITLEFSGVTVATDDVLTATIMCSPPMPMFTVPSGAGQNGEQFVITGGSLA